MNIKLIKLTGENFKGQKSFTANFDGFNTTILGENGSGKTTIYDMVVWCLFNKDSTGRAAFEVRPLDKNNEAIKALVTVVEMELDFDGVIHTLRKELHENVVKGQLRGYETLCYVDEVPKKVSDYQKWISEKVNEDTFKLLTDLHYFNEKLHWKDRRKVLLEIAGKIEIPEGFEELIEALNGRKIDEYKQVLADQKKRLVKERDEISPRIDEINKGLAMYAKVDNSAIDKDRQSVKTEIDNLDKKRQDLLSQEKDRQTKIEQLNQLKAAKLNREFELKNDTSAIQKYIDEKVKTEQAVAKVKQSVVDVENEIKAEQRILQNDTAEKESCLKMLEPVRKGFEDLSKPLDGLNCSACGQKLPENKIAELEKNRKANLTEIVKRGNQIKADIDNCKKAISESEEKIKALNVKLEQSKIQVQEAEKYRTERFAKIDEILKNKPAPDFSKDEIWQKITADIAKSEKAIGEPTTKQLEDIEAQRKAKAEELEIFNRALAQADQAKQAGLRIKELEAKEKQLAQQITDVDRMTALIGEYISAESSLVEAAVNGKFKHVNFKLFSENLNGSIEPYCEAMLNGVPYSDMSCGQKIIVGIDIINVLSIHYDLSVVLFIDNAESLTLPMEATSQVIKLIAEPNCTKVRVCPAGLENAKPENLFEAEEEKPVKKPRKRAS